jgi:hypothetical protein
MVLGLFYILPMIDAIMACLDVYNDRVLDLLISRGATLDILRDRTNIWLQLEVRMVYSRGPSSYTIDSGFFPIFKKYNIDYLSRSELLALYLKLQEENKISARVQNRVNAQLNIDGYLDHFFLENDMSAFPVTADSCVDRHTLRLLSYHNRGYKCWICGHNGHGYYYSCYPDCGRSYHPSCVIFIPKDLNDRRKHPHKVSYENMENVYKPLTMKCELCHYVGPHTGAIWYRCQEENITYHAKCLVKVIEKNESF